MNKKNTMPSYLVELEHELAAALRKVDEQKELLRLCKEENDEKHKDIIWGMGERAKLMERIKRLEESGDKLAYWFEAKEQKHFDALESWRKAKEAKL
jgi:predicted ArsR family transcriptional regulator